MAPTGKSQYLVWPPSHKVFFSNLLAYYNQASFSTCQSSSLDLVCLLFLSLSRWSHTASIIFRSGLCGGQSMTVSVLSAVFLSKYDFTALAVCLGLLSCWKINHSQSGAFRKERHDELKPVCTFQHSWSHQFWQYCQHHWQKCSPKPGQTLHHVSLKAASTHSSISLQLFFSHIVDDRTQKFQTWICHSIILFSTDLHSNFCEFQQS